jgi:hypothetical protein
VTAAWMALVERPWVLFAVLLLGLTLVVELGHRLGLATAANFDEQLREPLVATRDSVGLLLSLLLGFTLAMALPRYEERKKLVVDEANAIGTTALRAQMLSEPARAKILQLLSEYLEARVNFSAASLDAQELQQPLERARQLQDQLWRESVGVAQQNPTPVTSLFVQALNESIDLAEKRRATLENRIPRAIWILLALVSLLSCLTIGVSERQRFWFVMIISPLTIAIVMALIADLDAPRSGLIQVGQESLRRVQQDLKSGAELALPNPARRPP